MMMNEISVHDSVLKLTNEFAGERRTSPVPGFGDILKDSYADVNRFQNDKDLAVQNLLTENGGDIHNTMIAIQKAHISFKLMMQVRNKIVTAYEEIMRMNV
ncbi:MAG: flagellar hook-basal body complex protein FliE [Desulfococcaceae bacterium]|jgi:flagellar hook-basal body complex protein FliE|nr:flagellar hook-basal body complex protein FliE [Desulfococcaceae bacterium]